MEDVSDCLKVSNVIAQVLRGLAWSVFRFIAKIQVKRPQLGLAKRSEVGGV
jgi:hypothetical protein